MRMIKPILFVILTTGMFNLIFKDPSGNRLSGPFGIGIRIRQSRLRVLELAAPRTTHFLRLP